MKNLLLFLRKLLEITGELMVRYRRLTLLKPHLNESVGKKFKAFAHKDKE